MDTAVIICFSIVFGLLGLLGFLLFKIRNAPEEEISSPPNDETTEQRPTTSKSDKSQTNNQNELRVGSKVIKSRNVKTPVAKRTVRSEEDNNDLNDDDDMNTASTSNNLMESGKIGKKKLQKLGNYDNNQYASTKILIFFFHLIYII